MRFAGAVPAPLGGGGLRGGRLYSGRLPPSGALELPSGPMGAPSHHPWALRSGGGGGGGLPLGEPHLSYYRVHLAWEREEAQPSEAVRASCEARGEPSFFKDRPGGKGSPAQGMSGASCKANGGPVPSENRAHRPGGDGGSS